MTEKQSIDRRQFLSKVGALATGTAAIAVANSPAIQAAPIKTPVASSHSASEDKGYQRTQHVDTYYQLADF